MRTVRLPSGVEVPCLGQGTWRLGEHPATRDAEIATLREGIDMGLSLIDTAEMYGEGRTELLVGEAIRGRRDEVFLVSKVYPHNASRKAMRAACTDSLQRLGTDRLDLYLLHWRGGVRIEETLAAFGSLQREGLIRAYGVSNLDADDMGELWQRPGGDKVQTDQVLYNLLRRGVEWDLLPWLRKHRLPVMAYSPVEQGRLVADARLVGFAKKYGMTPAQAALAWLLSKDDVIAIPKTSSQERLRENFGALALRLAPAQLEELDRLFPPPAGPQPLEMI